MIGQVLPPIPTEGLTADDVTKLSEETRIKMLKVFNEISVESNRKNAEIMAES